MGHLRHRVWDLGVAFIFSKGHTYLYTHLYSLSFTDHAQLHPCCGTYWALCPTGKWERAELASCPTGQCLPGVDQALPNGCS